MFINDVLYKYIYIYIYHVATNVTYFGLKYTFDP